MKPGIAPRGAYAELLPRPALDSDAVLTRERLVNQQIAGSVAPSPEELVRWLGAVQAQDYPASLWALGLRLRGAVEADVEASIEAGRIVRTWPMRRTLHFVPAEDVRWMLRLLASRVVSASAGRYRALGLDEADFARAGRILSRASRGGRRLTRAEAYEELARGGVAPTGQRGIHVLAHLAQSGLVCFGPRRERQPTFVLLEDWIARSEEPTRDEALATLATRYFTSHGPATLQDFAWWSGLPVRDARRAAEAAGAALRVLPRDEPTRYSAARSRRVRNRAPVAILLPPWDEYLVAYRDRSLLTRPLGRPIGPELLAKPLLLVDGLVRGAWKRSLTGSRARVTLDLWTPLTAVERRAVRQAVERYGRFIGLDLHDLEADAS